MDGWMRYDARNTLILAQAAGGEHGLIAGSKIDYQECAGFPKVSPGRQPKAVYISALAT